MELGLALARELGLVIGQDFLTCHRQVHLCLEHSLRPLLPLPLLLAQASCWRMQGSQSSAGTSRSESRPLECRGGLQSPPAGPQPRPRHCWRPPHYHLEAASCLHRPPGRCRRRQPPWRCRRRQPPSLRQRPRQSPHHRHRRPCCSPPRRCPQSRVAGRWRGPMKMVRQQRSGGPVLQLTLVLPGCAGLAVLQRCRRRQQVLEPQLVSCTQLPARRCETTRYASRQRLQNRHALPPPVPSSRAVTCARVNLGWLR